MASSLPLFLVRKIIYITGFSIMPDKSDYPMSSIVSVQRVYQDLTPFCTVAEGSSDKNIVVSTLCEWALQFAL
jgi:hypothetical protein